MLQHPCSLQGYPKTSSQVPGASSSQISSAGNFKFRNKKKLKHFFCHFNKSISDTAFCLSMQNSLCLVLPSVLTHSPSRTKLIWFPELEVPVTWELVLGYALHPCHQLIRVYGQAQGQGMINRNSLRYVTLRIQN